jgi:hypothetical protein
MSLEQLVHKVEGELFDLGKRLWGDESAPQSEETDGPGTDLEQAYDALNRCRCPRQLVRSVAAAVELQQAYDALSRCRAAATETRRRIAANEVKAALLASQVETCLQTGDRDAAWQLALELDQVRQYLVADRGELPYLEKACSNQRRHIAQVERRLGEVQARVGHS